MRRFTHIFLAIMICMAISAPEMDARGRNNGDNNTSSPVNKESNSHSPDRHGESKGTTRGRKRPKHDDNNKHNGHDNKRPGHGNVRPSDNHGNNHNGVRPGNNHGQGNRPGNLRPGNGQHHHGGIRPGDNHGNVHHKHHHTGRPKHISHVPHHAPHRPMLPPPVHYRPPMPPPHFRPAPRAPRFSTILGIALGSAITYTIDRLINTGYYVSGYTNNAVYINDVPMLNMMWPTSTLYYNSGRLAGSEFVYSTPHYDTGRYRLAYNSLVRNYGEPVSYTSLPGGGMSATWFGYDGRYVTLQYAPDNAMDGILRYYTTLSFGN